MYCLYRQENHYAEFCEIWKTYPGYNVTEWCFNGNDRCDLYETKFNTLPQAMQFIGNLWFNYR